MYITCQQITIYYFFPFVSDLMSIHLLVKTIIRSNNLSVSFRSFCNGTTKMAENIYTGVLLSTILKGLEKFAPLKLAESWDNVGLLVDPLEPVYIKKILLTNDLTEDVMYEALSHQAGLIITYHPNIFQGLKSVTSRYVIQNSYSCKLLDDDATIVC